MKIKYRLLSLVLAVSLMLSGVYVTGALADTAAQSGTEGENNKEPIGSYTAPESSWDPTEGENATAYAGITFAAFASEEDFLKGNAPAKWFKGTDMLTNSTVGVDAAVKYPYVHLFADASTDTAGQLWLADNQQLTINLGGHTLNVPQGIRVGNDSSNVRSTYLMVKNGTFVHTGYQMHTRPGITRIFENVVYNSSTNCLAYDGGAKLLEYRNCEINLSHGSALFDLAIFNSVESRLNFIGTKIVQSARAATPLFRISTPVSADATSAWTVFFDSGSSVERSSGVPLFTFSHSFTPVYIEPPTDKQLADTQEYRNFGKKNTIIYEPGFKISPDALVDSYIEDNYYRSDDKKHGTEQTVSYTDNDPILKQIMYQKGTTFEIDMLVTLGEDGMHEYIAAPSQDSVWSPATANDGVDYTGITYAVWKSEADFLLGKTPEAWYKDSTLSSKNVGTTDIWGEQFAYSYTPGYVQMYADLTTYGYNNGAGQVVTGMEQALIIDLGGHTLDDSQGFRIGGASESHPNASLTLRNGIYNYKDGQMQTRPETTLIFEDLTINATRNGDLVYDGGAKLIRYKNCTLNASHSKNFFSLSGGTDSIDSKFEIIGSTFNFSTAPENALFVITQTYSPGIVADWKITVDKNSTINGPITSWMYLIDSYNYAHSSAHEYYDQRGKFTKTQTLTLEDGVTLKGGAQLSLTYKHTEIDFAASEAQSSDATEANDKTLDCGCKEAKTVVVQEDKVKTANDANCMIVTSTVPTCTHEDKDDDLKCDKCGEPHDDGIEPCDHVDKDDDLSAISAVSPMTTARSLAYTVTPIRISDAISAVLFITSPQISIRVNIHP